VTNKTKDFVKSKEIGNKTIHIKNPLGIDKEVWDEIHPKNKKKIFQAIAKYKDNKWWLSKDPIEVAKYQIFEPVFLSDFALVWEGTNRLLGRNVLFREFGSGIKCLRKEVKEALRKEKSNLVSIEKTSESEYAIASLKRSD
jgi:hypothetical protein